MVPNAQSTHSPVSSTICTLLRPVMETDYPLITWPILVMMETHPFYTNLRLFMLFIVSLTLMLKFNGHCSSIEKRGFQAVADYRALSSWVDCHQYPRSGVVTKKGDVGHAYLPFCHSKKQPLDSWQILTLSRPQNWTNGTWFLHTVLNLWYSVLSTANSLRQFSKYRYVFPKSCLFLKYHYTMLNKLVTVKDQMKERCPRHSKQTKLLVSLDEARVPSLRLTN